jgi:hypothetical protein
MRQHLSTIFLISALTLAAPASARSNFQSTVEAPLSGAVKLEVIIGEELAYRAENLPKKLSDRGSGSRFGKGFGKNGNYGERDIARLQARLERKVAAQFTRKGITLSDNAPTVLRVTLTNAKPNRPTINQLSKEPGLSYRSFGLGGAEIEAELLSASGQPLGNMQYKFYEDDIRDAAFTGTWTDAHRSFDRFARKAAKQLTS